MEWPDDVLFDDEVREVDESVKCRVMFGVESSDGVCAPLISSIRPDCKLSPNLLCDLDSSTGDYDSRHHVKAASLKHSLSLFPARGQTPHKQERAAHNARLSEPRASLAAELRPNRFASALPAKRACRRPRALWRLLISDQSGQGTSGAIAQ